MSKMDRQEIEQEKLREKTVLLHELSRMEMSGSKMARNLSMEDPLADIEFELNRTRAKEDCVSTVSFMKDAIRLGVTGIELLNNKFNVLKLQGWSGEATRDMNRYDRSLTKLYTRYMRRGSVSPIIELGFLIFGSMLVTHMKNAFLGPSAPIPAAFSAPRASPPPTAPPSRNIPFATPQQRRPASSQDTRAPEAATQQRRRPTMRRPTMRGMMSGPLGNIVGGAAPSSTSGPGGVPPPAMPVGGVAFMMMRGANHPPTQSPMSRPEIKEELEVDIEQKRARGGNLGGIEEVIANEAEGIDKDMGGDMEEEEDTHEDTDGDSDEMAF